MQEQTTIEKTELKVPSTVKALIEALIFAAKEPLTINQLRSICENENIKDLQGKINTEFVRQIVLDLNKEYEKSDKPYRIVQIAGGYQFATLPVYAQWLGKLYKEQNRRKLSQSSIETLAIIAYKQPITKSEIENIRGVNCDYVLKTLLEKDLIVVTGRAESVGRPLLYGTTREFLKHFGLNDITDLPRPREIEEILGESQYEIERRMLEAQAAAEKAKKEEEYKSRLPHIPKKKPELDAKEVEILKRSKSQTIKTFSSEEEKVTEEDTQEKIEFSVEVETNQNQNSIIDKVDKEELNKADIEEGTHIDTEVTELSSETEIEKSETIQIESKTLKRWQVWKEKIRVFIKKLFA